MVHFEISKDQGRTWEVVGPINDGKQFDAIQPSVLFYPGNRMQVLCRTRQDVVSQSWSEDNGNTWSEMVARSEEHTSELQSLMRISYAVFCLKKKTSENKKKHKRVKKKHNRNTRN